MREEQGSDRYGKEGRSEPGGAESVAMMPTKDEPPSWAQSMHVYFDPE